MDADANCSRRNSVSPLKGKGVEWRATEGSEIHGLRDIR